MSLCVSALQKANDLSYQHQTWCTYLYGRNYRHALILRSKGHRSKSNGCEVCYQRGYACGYCEYVTSCGGTASFTELEKCPRLRIEVSPTAFQTESLTLTQTLTSDLDLQSMRAMLMTHTYATGQGQRSLGSKVRVETDSQTDGRTEAIANLISRANAVGNRC